ncbi:hypothetical protein LCGC14_1511230 [marine sediment metagenome]|uniref:Uncharacterized protein n=1 Tax=marine sediment metagenome TaxID=412755 RepID=A0A0F9M2H4_9ZZZZ
MKTYRTRLGYLRTNSKGRRDFKEFLSTLKPIQLDKCWHWQCGCGGFDMVEYKGRIYCNTCSRLRYASTTRGAIYYTADDVINCQYCIKAQTPS